MHFISKNEVETKEIARRIGGRLSGGEILALSGDLGAGKTVFTKGLAEALGVEKQITSPTFVILKKYNTNNQNILSLVHVDAYRLSSSDDAGAIGLPEIFEDKHAATVIEWPENIWAILPQEKLIRIKFNYLDENRREISAEGIDI